MSKTFAKNKVEINKVEINKYEILKRVWKKIFFPIHYL